MSFFKKKEGASQNLSFIAIIAAINVIFIFLTSFIPFLFVLLVLVLPFTSSLVWLFTQKRYYLIYSFALIGLSLITIAWQVTDTIFYVVPGLISGLAFGLLAEKKISSVWIIFITSVIEVGLTYASFPLIQLIVEVDAVDQFIQLVGLADFEFKYSVALIFVFVLSLIQSSIEYYIFQGEFKKMGIELNDEPEQFISAITMLSLIAVGFVLSIFEVMYPFALLSLAFAIYFAIYLSILLIKHNIKTLFGIVPALVAAILTFMLTYNHLNAVLNILCLNIFPFVIGNIAIVVYISNRNNATIIK